MVWKKTESKNSFFPHFPRISGDKQPSLYVSIKFEQFFFKASHWSMAAELQQLNWSFAPRSFNHWFCTNSTPMGRVGLYVAMYIYVRLYVCKSLILNNCLEASHWPSDHMVRSQPLIGHPPPLTPPSNHPHPPPHIFSFLFFLFLKSPLVSA